MSQPSDDIWKMPRPERVDRGRKYEAGESLYVDPISRITVDPRMMSGAPCIRGRRLRVEDVLDRLGAGESIAVIQEDHPFLDDDDFIAVYRYAQMCVMRMTEELQRNQQERGK